MEKNPQQTAAERKQAEVYIYATDFDWKKTFSDLVNTVNAMAFVSNHTAFSAQGGIGR